MRDRILSSVLFPAPFLPMMPITSPWAILKLTSSKAQKTQGFSLTISFSGWRMSRRKGACAARSTSSRRFSVRVACCLSWYCLDTFRISSIGFIANSSLAPDGGRSNNVCEAVFHTPKNHQPGEKQQRADGQRPTHYRPGSGASQQSMAEANDHTRHGIQTQQNLKVLRKIARRIDDGSDEKTHLHQERHGVLHVAKAHIHGGQD